MSLITSLVRVASSDEIGDDELSAVLKSDVAQMGGWTLSEVFISYSRTDASFVQQLHAALEKRERACWIDWCDIPPAAAWMDEIRRAIDSAENFLFILSEHSETSEICMDELAHAVSRGKRVISVVLSDKLSSDTLPTALKKINWIFCLDGDSLPRALAEILEALDTRGTEGRSQSTET